MVMTDLEFLTQAEALLKTVEIRCDQINEELDIDLDNQRVGSMVTLTFADRSQIVINLQKPLHEVWMASKSGGYHYKWQNNSWQDTKGQGEFFSHLSAQASIHSNQTLYFKSGTD
jgi:CyaY protein